MHTFTKFTDATNDVATDGISEHRLISLAYVINHYYFKNRGFPWGATGNSSFPKRTKM